MSSVRIENLDENDDISVDVSRGGQLLNTFVIPAGEDRELAVGGHQSLIVTAGVAQEETATDAEADIPLGADVSDAPDAEDKGEGPVDEDSASSPDPAADQADLGPSNPEANQAGLVQSNPEANQEEKSAPAADSNPFAPQAG